MKFPTFRFNVESAYPFPPTGGIILRGWLVEGTLCEKAVVSFSLRSGKEQRGVVLALARVRGEGSERAGSNISAGEHSVQIDVVLIGCHILPQIATEILPCEMKSAEFDYEKYFDFLRRKTENNCLGGEVSFPAVRFEVGCCHQDK